MKESHVRNSKKRRIIDDGRPISPPPLRRKVSAISKPPKGLNTINRFEIISWNVNGVGPFLASQTPKITSFFNNGKSRGETPPKEEGKEEYTLRNFLKRHNWPQMLCLQEVKINLKDDTTKRALERAANGGDGPGYTAFYSLPRDKFNAKGFGGKVHGVCTIIRDDVVDGESEKALTKDVDWDLEGRVLITELERWSLAVVNGYWVNGTTNPYRDPKTGEITGTRNDRKRVFHSSMLEEVKFYESRGWNVVLVGDMNVAREAIDGYPGIRLGYDHVKNRSDFNSKFFEDPNGMGGIDTFRHLHGRQQKYSYHGERPEEWGRSCDRVDLGIVSRKLVEECCALIGADIWDSVEERGHSDHVPIGVVLDLKKLDARPAMDL